MQPPIWPGPVYRLASAIIRAEGSNPAWSNPGDLTGSDAFGFPTIGVANADGVLKFINTQDGIDALHVKVWRMLRGISSVYTLDMTLEQVGQKYANRDGSWAKNVASFLGVSVTTTLREIANGTAA